MNRFSTLTFSKVDRIGYIMLDRPKSMNAFNIQMRDELFEVLWAIKDDPDISVGIIHGAGDKAFCAGADLNEFLTAPSPITARTIRQKRDVWGLFTSIPQPLIAALHGYVLGSGIEVALCCDFRIATQEAIFGMPEVALGMIPAAGGTQTLPRTVGISRTLELLFTGKWIDSTEAYRIGLADKVVPREDLLDHANQLANLLHPGFDCRQVRKASHIEGP
jgi:enoyl-CoA hydratase/carnithine racemase